MSGKHMTVLGFEGGSLTIRAEGYAENGSGYLCFNDDDLQYEPEDESPGTYRSLELPKSELVAIRNHLNEHIPAGEDGPDSVALVWSTRPPSKALKEVLSLAATPWVITPIAHAFQAAGYMIPKKAEEEWSFVLHWLIGVALKHGDQWRSVAGDRLVELGDMAKARAS